MLTLTMLLESILKPRATRTMSLLDRFGELVISIVICRGTLYSGDERLVACYRGVVAQPDLHCVWFAHRSCGNARCNSNPLVPPSRADPMAAEPYGWHAVCSMVHLCASVLCGLRCMLRGAVDGSDPSNGDDRVYPALICLTISLYRAPLLAIFAAPTYIRYV